MSIEKSEFKIAVLNDVGADAEDMLEGVKSQIAEHKGAKMALRELVGKLEPIKVAIHADLDNGVIDKVIAAGSIDVAKYALQQISMCVNAIVGSAQHQENLQLASQGAASFAIGFVDRLSKKAAAESGKIEAMKSSQVAAGSGPRVTGVHPGPGLVATRKSEEQAEKKPKKKRVSKKKAA